MTLKIDTPARARLHFERCPGVGDCRFVGGAGDRQRCARFDELIDQVENDHARVLSQVLRDEAAVWGVDTAAGRHTLTAAGLIDPEMASSVTRASARPFTPPVSPPPPSGSRPPLKPRRDDE